MSELEGLSDWFTLDYVLSIKFVYLSLILTCDEHHYLHMDLCNVSVNEFELLFGSQIAMNEHDQ